MDRGPIFIGGLDRSGKTLLRLMLSSHPNIVLTRRTYMWARFYNRYGDLSRSDQFELCLAAMLKSKHIRALNPDPARIRREFRQGEPTYARLFALIQQSYAEQVGKPRWGDQMGFIECYADQIFAAYPTAKLIHMIRDPRERYEASMPAAQSGQGKVGWDTGRWLSSARLAQRHLQHYPLCYKIVNYEKLMMQPEETLRDVCAFLEEDLVPSMLTLEGAIRFGDTATDSINESADQDVGAMRHGVMSRRERAFMQRHARRELQWCGYAQDSIRLSPREQLLYACLDWPVNSAGLTGWRVWGSRRPVKQ